MSSWFKKELGDAVMAAPVLEELKEQFSAMYKSQKDSEAAAAFVRYDSGNLLHCEVTVYFSPAAVTLANEIGASPCVMPATNGLSLLVGSATIFSDLFKPVDQ